MKNLYAWTLLVLASLVATTASDARAAESQAHDAQTVYEAALAELGQGDAAEAAATLETLLAREGFAPGALVALGDAYLTQGQTGRAIVAYERALRARPDDAARVRERLDEAYERVGEQAPSPRRAQLAAATLSPEAWLAVGATAAALLLLAGLGMGLRWHHRGLWLTLGVASAVALLTSAGALHLGVEDGDQAIVTASADALVSPIDGAEVVLRTRPGRSFEPLARRGDRIQVRFRSGVVGWVPADSIATIDPRAMDALPTL